MKLVELTGEAVDWIEAVAWQISKASEVGELRRVCVAIDSDGVKFKLNSGTWTPGYGTVTVDDENITREEEQAWNEWR